MERLCSGFVYRFDTNVSSFVRTPNIEPPTHSSSIHANSEIKKIQNERNEEQQKIDTTSSDTCTTINEYKEAKMGNKTIKTTKKRTNFTELTDNDIDILVSSTKFSIQQIHEWHQSFIRNCPSGKLDRKHFIEVYKQFYPEGNAKKICSLAFEVFDRDKNGFIDFNEFLTAITLTMTGEPKDRFDLAFSMYDTNGDNLLDKKEIIHIIKLVNSMHEKQAIKQDLPAEDIARMIIERFDTNGDKKISREEFIIGCLNNFELRKLLIP